MEKVFEECFEFLSRVNYASGVVLSQNQKKLVTNVIERIESDLIVAKPNEFDMLKQQLETFINVRYNVSKLRFSCEMNRDNDNRKKEIITAKSEDEAVEKISTIIVSLVKSLDTLDPLNKTEKISPFDDINRGLYDDARNILSGMINNQVLNSILEDEFNKFIIRSKKDIETQIGIIFNSTKINIKKIKNMNGEILSTEVFNTNGSGIEQGGPTLTLKGPGFRSSLSTNAFNTGNNLEETTSYTEGLPTTGIFK